MCREIVVRDGVTRDDMPVFFFLFVFVENGRLYQGPTRTGDPYEPDMSRLRIEFCSDGLPWVLGPGPIQPTLLAMADMAVPRRPPDCSL